MDTNPRGPTVAPTRETQLADLGELAGPLAHEFNNLLNNLMLQLAVMRQEAPQGLATDLDEIRKQAGAVAGEVTRFQRHRRLDAAEPGTVDLNVILRDAAEQLPHEPLDATGGLPAAPVTLDPGANLLAVRGHAGDLLRLCRFLLRNAAHGAAPVGGRVTARTAVAGGRVQLQVEDSGPAVPEEKLPRIFEPGHEAREGMCCLQLAACKSIVRRLGGKIHARGRPEGGLEIVVELPAA